MTRFAHQRQLHWTALVVLGCAVYTLVQLLVLSDPNPVDDAFITFTYSKNLAAGQGLTFTQGERVLGSTSPLFALVLALLSWLLPSVAIPFLALGVNAVALAGTALIIHLFFAKLDPSYRVAGMMTALLLCFNQQCLTSCIGGMESMFFVALLLAAIVATIHERQLTAGVLLGFCFLTRPEGALAEAAVVLVYCITRKRFPFPLLVASALSILPWFFFATMYFGSPIPHNLIVKLKAFHHYDAAPGATLRILLGRLFVAFGYEPDLGSMPAGFFPILSGAILFGFGAVFSLSHRDSLYFYIFVLFYLLFYGLSNKLYFGWYSIPLVPFTLIWVIGGSQALWSLLKLPSSRVMWCPTTIFLALFFLGIERHLAFRESDASYLQAMPGREKAYRDAAYFLNKRSLTPQTVALPEIGAFGFFSEHHCIDLVGLITKEALPLRVEGRSYWEISEHFGVKWIVTHSMFMRQFSYADAFRRNFQPIAKFGDTYVFERIDPVNDRPYVLLLQEIPLVERKQSVRISRSPPRPFRAQAIIAPSIYKDASPPLPRPA